jgi:hypothetical protein
MFLQTSFNVSQWVQCISVQGFNNPRGVYKQLLPWSSPSYISNVFIEVIFSHEILRFLTFHHIIEGQYFIPCSNTNEHKSSYKSTSSFEFITRCKYPRGDCTPNKCTVCCLSPHCRAKSRLMLLEVPDSVFLYRLKVDHLQAARVGHHCDYL